MFLYSLLVWLQATICIQTILQDFSQSVKEQYKQMIAQADEGMQEKGNKEQEM